MNLQKREKGGGVPTTSPMLKLAKRMEKIKPIGVDRTVYLFSMMGGGGGG